MTTSEVRPGDMLVIGMTEGSIEAADNLAEQLRELLPGVKIVLVENVTAMTVYRPAGSTEGGK